MSTTAVPSETSSPDDSDFGSLSNKPFAWVLIPLGIFIFIGVAATIYQIRRRRRRRRRGTLQWPGGSSRQLLTPGGRVAALRARPDRRRTGLGTTRSEEGLNELGEAPPPYDGKKDGPQDDGTELRDLEAGEASPPDYPAEPAPAVTTESRRAV
ncbi:hypothetical protein G7Z17_g9973 [Cylindrodendrum hubeiense]|uniref:Uncharacterized protein n=1 Tax=Cylindrodendrum hubeiense TaxID=595255 RepID=A0A9P5LD53_9HYPO|nr:hypothetical protein G7Z17_g9973 [Cylindrodendrum hubeiense]